MARSLSNAKVISAIVVDGFSLAIHRYFAFMVKSLCFVLLARNEGKMKSRGCLEFQSEDSSFSFAFSALLVN